LTFKEDLIPQFLKIEREGTLPISFYEANIILIHPQTKHEHNTKVNYTSISLMNIVAKLLNKILAK
jgi:hypothetical protein